MNTCARFITDGIRDTMAHYRRDELPLHRLSWELRSRIDTLVPHAPSVWVNQLRELQRRVAEVHALGDRTGLSPAEREAVDDSLRQLTVALERPQP
jgi:hypothetical protein